MSLPTIPRRVKGRSFTIFALLAAMTVAWPCLGAAQGAPTRPNIVYIMSDDQGWADVGYHGSDIQTPNIDALAHGGTTLDQYYAQPMCTPTRAALMTGRYPHRYGLQTLVIPSAGTYGLATDEWLLPQALDEAGYRTAIVGKWHLGHADMQYWPRQRGFDYQYGPILGEIDYYTHSAHGTLDWFRDNQPVHEEGYATTLLGDDAVRLIEAHDPKTPLFLYLAFTAPHAPYQAPQAYLDRYASISDPSRRTYAAMITAMDEQVGRVVAALERRGMRRNTLIIFQSDNGGPRDARVTGEVDMSHAVIPASNGPFRGGKGTLYEGGTRVIALANWPGHIPAGGSMHQPMHVVDMYPTLVGLAGGSTARAKPLDGLDMWRTLSAGAPSPRTEVVYDIEPFRAAFRQGPWKLVWQATLPSKVELFNLAQDSTESVNLAERYPERVSALQAQVQAQAATAVRPLLLVEVSGLAKTVLMGSVATPEEVRELEGQP